MSKQIARLMERYPQIFYSVSYEGNKWDGDGTWLFMRPGWYDKRTECGTIHEYSISDVLAAAAEAFQDKDRWIADHLNEADEIEKVLRGDYDRN